MLALLKDQTMRHTPSSSVDSPIDSKSTKPALLTMPDPYGRYANILGRHPHLKSTVINTPTIRDRNGALILPSDYSTKLPDQTVVFATVKLRLYILFLLFLCYHF